MDKILPLSHFMGSSVTESEEFIVKSGKPLLNSKKTIKENVIIDVLCNIYDPELPVSIYDLGLIYKIEILNNNNIRIDMSLTAPACPVAGELPKEVADKVAQINYVGEVEVKLVWEPTWTQDRMSEDAKLLLGID